MAELTLIEGGLHAADVAAVNVEAAQSEIPAVKSFDVADLTDTELVEKHAALIEELAHVKELLGGFIRGCEFEIERRIRESGGRAMPHAEYEIEIVEEYGPYRYDLDLLNDAAALLPDTERAKIIKHVPEYTQIIAAHDEPGNPVSINALIRKYGEDSALGQTLRSAMQRDKTGERLKIKPRKAALPPGGTAR